MNLILEINIYCFYQCQLEGEDNIFATLCRELVHSDSFIFYPVKYRKGIESLPQTRIFKSLYHCNLKKYTFDTSNLNYYLTEFIV